MVKLDLQELASEDPAGSCQGGHSYRNEWDGQRGICDIVG